jgi:hypothetical protein
VPRACRPARVAVALSQMATTPTDARLLYAGMPTLHDLDIISNRNGKTVALSQAVARKLGSVTTTVCAGDNYWASVDVPESLALQSRSQMRRPRRAHLLRRPTLTTGLLVPPSSQQFADTPAADSSDRCRGICGAAARTADGGRSKPVWEPPAANAMVRQ